jgi:hypothetical protein
MVMGGMVNEWPYQSDAIKFYGNPALPNGVLNIAWQKNNLTTISVPFLMRMGSVFISRITIHRKCAYSLTRILNAIWAASGKNQNIINAWGMCYFSGTFAFRSMRGINELSMHSFGCAIDIDAEHNPLGGVGKFTPESPVVKAFEAENWVWGGRWHGREDPMHFQAAKVNIELAS